jgi:hypothetical protein
LDFCGEFFNAAGSDFAWREELCSEYDKRSDLRLSIFDFVDLGSSDDVETIVEHSGDRCVVETDFFLLLLHLLVCCSARCLQRGALLFLLRPPERFLWIRWRPAHVCWWCFPGRGRRRNVGSAEADNCRGRD